MEASRKNNSKAVRILVADDHDIFRRGLRVLLEAQPGWEVADEAITGREAVEKARALKPNVVVMDISMPDLNGLEACRQIRRESPQTEVLVLSLHESEQVVRDVLTAGARGYVLKTDSERDLVVAVDALRQHKPFFTARAMEMLVEGMTRQGPTQPREESRNRLTPREREIIQLLAEGKSSKEVAARLGISVKTAETHRANIMRKLNLHSVSALVCYAVRNNVIEP